MSYTSPYQLYQSSIGMDFLPSSSHTHSEELLAQLQSSAKLNPANFFIDFNRIIRQESGNANNSNDLPVVEPMEEVNSSPPETYLFTSSATNNLTLANNTNLHPPNIGATSLLTNPYSPYPNLFSTPVGTDILLKQEVPLTTFDDSTFNFTTASNNTVPITPNNVFTPFSPNATIYEQDFGSASSGPIQSPFYTNTSNSTSMTTPDSNAHSISPLTGYSSNTSNSSHSPQQTIDTNSPPITPNINSGTTTPIIKNESDLSLAAMANEVEMPGLISYSQLDHSSHSHAHDHSHSHSHSRPHPHTNTVRQSEPLQSYTPPEAHHHAASATPTATGKAASTIPHKPVKNACIACRKLKAACDEQRPCSRCVKFGRECVDRSEEEIKAAKSRKKKKPSVAAAATATATTATPSIADTNPTPQQPTPKHSRPRSDQRQTSPTQSSSPSQTSPLTNLSTPPSQHSYLDSPLANAPILDPSDPTSYANSVEATESISAQLYSRCMLAVLIRLGLRDSILTNHARLDSRNPPVPVHDMLVWHSQVNLMLLQLGDQLLPEDFTAFIVNGLSESQLNSSMFLGSPLAAWQRLATRPFHYAVQPNTAVLEQPLPPDDPLMSETNVQLKFEYLPAANASFQRWQNMIRQRLQFEYELKVERFRDSNAPIHQKSPPSVTVTPAIHTMCADVPSRRISDEDDLADHFSVLCIARALEAKPLKATHHDTITNVHAAWCPQSQYAGMDDLTSDSNSEPAKYQRVDGMNSVHAHPSSASSSAPECVCSMSTPLPMRLWVTPAFEKYLGWRRVDYERGLMREGQKWNRRLYPPSSWPFALQGQVSHSKLTLDIVANRLMKIIDPKLAPTASASASPRSSSNNRFIACYTTTPLSGSTDQSPAAPVIVHTAASSVVHPAPAFITRHGQLVTAATKELTVQASDGKAQPSALLIRWNIPTIQKQIDEQKQQRQYRHH